MQIVAIGKPAASASWSENSHVAKVQLFNFGFFSRWIKIIYTDFSVVSPFFQLIYTLILFGTVLCCCLPSTGWGRQCDCWSIGMMLYYLLVTQHNALAWRIMLDAGCKDTPLKKPRWTITEIPANWWVWRWCGWVPFFNETVFRVHVSGGACTVCFFDLYILFTVYIKHIGISPHPECQSKANTSLDPLSGTCKLLALTK